MIGSTRAFLIVALFALPVAATLHLLTLLGLPGAWRAMIHLTIFGWITAMIVAVSYHTMPVFSGRDFPSPLPPIPLRLKLPRSTFPRSIACHCWTARRV